MLHVPAPRQKLHRIALLRFISGFSLQRLSYALKTGYSISASPSMLQRIENGQACSEEVAAALARFFRCSVDDVTGFLDSREVSRVNRNHFFAPEERQSNA
jgi:hypothetical protein